MNDTATLTIHTHYQVSITERRRMPQGMNERHRKNPQLRPDWVQARTWANTNADKEARHGRYKFHTPEWLMRKNGVHVFRTLTASIVWGICGKRADVEEIS